MALYKGYLLSLIDGSRSKVTARIFLEQFSFDGAVFVVDSADRERFSETKSCLNDVRKFVGTDKPLLILGNKIDLDGAVSEYELVKKLELPSSVDWAVKDAVLALLIINKRKEGFGIGRIPRDIALIIAKMVFSTSKDFKSWQMAANFAEKSRNLLRGSVKILKKNVALQMCSFAKEIGYWKGFEWLLKSATNGYN